MSGKELIETVCLELNIDYKELAEKIGANSGTVKNWKSRNEVPLWAEKSINLLRENYKKDKFVSSFNDVFTFLENYREKSRSN